ncbi:hypothetical protein GF402_08790 [Candidatus Fermentibacteria bacterium]|nr:hypothetical protein [Candidatus Fermentibacteria bacterium]
MALKRQVKCPQCGAPKETLKDSVLVVCDYCGSFISVESGSFFRGDGYATLQEKQMRRLVEPSAADARKTQMQMKMEECRKESDREGFRLAAEEYTALLAATDPELVPGGGGNPSELREWASSTAKAQELMQFDPEVSQVYDEYRDLLQELHSSDEPVEKARELLDCAKRCYRALIDHPDYPSEVYGGVEKMARSMVRSAVAPMEALLGRGVAHRIYVEVLGDKEQGDEIVCDNCGATMSEEDIKAGRCPYCDGAMVVDEDPWLDNLMATWKGVSSMMRDDESLASAAISHPMGSYWSNRKLPEVEDALRFLRRAVGWMPQDVMKRQVANLVTAYAEEPDLAARISELGDRLEDWEPTERPEAETGEEAPGVPEAPEGDLSEDPWVIQTAAMWENVRESMDESNLEMGLLSQAMTPFYMGKSVSAEQAVAFFEKAEPDYSRREMKKALGLMKPGAQSDAQKEFLDRIGKLI